MYTFIVSDIEKREIDVFCDLSTVFKCFFLLDNFELHGRLDAL